MSINFSGNPYSPPNNQKSPFRTLLIATPIAATLWAGHMGSSMLLKSGIRPKLPDVQLVESQSQKLEKVRDAVNQNFDSTSISKYLSSDTLSIPDNVSAGSHSSLGRFFTAFFKTPAMDAQEVTATLKKIGTEKSFDNFNATPSEVMVHVKDGILADEQGKKYFAVDYYSK